MRRPDEEQIERGVELIQTHNDQEQKARENEQERHKQVMANLEENFAESREEIARTHLGFENIEELTEDIKDAFENYRGGPNPENINEAFQQHIVDNLESGGHPKNVAQDNRTFSVRDDGIHRYRATRNSMLKPSKFTQGNLRVHLIEALQAQDAWQEAERLIEAYDALQSHNRVHVSHTFDDSFQLRTSSTDWTELHADMKETFGGAPKVEITIKSAHYTRRSYQLPDTLLDNEQGLALYVSQTEEVFRILESLLDKTEAIGQRAEEAVEDIGVEL